MFPRVAEVGEWELPPFCYGTPIPNIIFPDCLSHPAAGPLRGVVLNKIDFHSSVICEMSCPETGHKPEEQP